MTRGMKSLFWNFEYKYNDSDERDRGLYWKLTCDRGTTNRYDYNNSTARSYAESFSSEVRNIYNQQCSAVAASGTAICAIIAGAITSETTVGAIAGIVVAAGAGIGTVAFWTGAWSAAQAANYNFERFVANV